MAAALSLYSRRSTEWSVPPTCWVLLHSIGANYFWVPSKPIAAPTVATTTTTNNNHNVRIGICPNKNGDTKPIRGESAHFAHKEMVNKFDCVMVFLQLRVSSIHTRSGVRVCVCVRANGKMALVASDVQLILCLTGSLSFLPASVA